MLEKLAENIGRLLNPRILSLAALVAPVNEAVAHNSTHTGKSPSDDKQRVLDDLKAPSLPGAADLIVETGVGPSIGPPRTERPITGTAITAEEVEQIYNDALNAGMWRSAKEFVDSFIPGSTNNPLKFGVGIALDAGVAGYHGAKEREAYVLNAINNLVAKGSDGYSVGLVAEIIKRKSSGDIFGSPHNGDYLDLLRATLTARARFINQQSGQAPSGAEPPSVQRARQAGEAYDKNAPAREAKQEQRRREAERARKERERQALDDYIAKRLLEQQVADEHYNEEQRLGQQPQIPSTPPGSGTNSGGSGTAPSQDWRNDDITKGPDGNRGGGSTSETSSGGNSDTSTESLNTEALGEGCSSEGSGDSGGGASEPTNEPLGETVLEPITLP